MNELQSMQKRDVIRVFVPCKFFSSFRVAKNIHKSGAVPVSYGVAAFTDAVVEAKFLLNTGEGQVLLSGYTAGLNVDGTVTLYRDQVAVVLSTAALTEGQWAAGDRFPDSNPRE